MVAVPAEEPSALKFGVKVTPPGSVSAGPMLSLGVGEPVAVTVKVPGVPTVKMAFETLVMVGAVAV